MNTAFETTFIYTLMVELNLTIREILSLKWSDINIRKRTISIYHRNVLIKYLNFSSSIKKMIDEIKIKDDYLFDCEMMPLSLIDKR
jgi:integrase